jgi:parallel beta-helix repeat protein
VWRRVRTFRAGAVLLAAALGPTSLAAQSIPVTVGIGAASTGAGEFDLPLTADMSARTERLGSFVVAVRWDPAVLEMLGGVDGSFGTITVNADTPGVVIMSGANPAGVSGLITLGVGRFRTLASLPTTFRVSVQELFAASTFADLSPSAVAIDREFCGDLVGTFGDVNDDNAVNGADALIVLSGSVGLDVSQYIMAFGDVDGDGDADPRDALIILSYAVGITTTQFRVGVATTSTCTVPAGVAFGVDPVGANALVGQDVQYYAFALDDQGAALALRNVTWTSSNGAVASVDGAGMATTLSAGTTTITAFEDGTAIATSTLTVGADRTTHWVDALASAARNQLGTAAHPFADLAGAVAVTTGRDTIRVRSGRYAGVTIAQPLVLTGDTSAGGTRPRIGPEGPGSPALTVAATGRVELRDLQVDSAQYGIYVDAADTVQLYHVDVRGVELGYAAVYADGLALLAVDRTRLFGQAGQDYYYYSDGLQAYNVSTLTLDSSLVADFDGDGLYAYGVDTIAIRRSTVRDNYGYGLLHSSAGGQPVQLTVSRSRFVQNYYGAVYASTFQNAAFDHNAFVGGGYTAVALYGVPASSIVSFLADTLDITGGPWAYVSNYDSALVDSAQVLRVTSSSDFYYGRTTVVQNSLFRDLRDDALLVYGNGESTSSARVWNTVFEGAGYAGYGGIGVTPEYVTMVVDSSRFDDVYYGIYGYYATVRVRKSAFTNAQYGIYAACMTGLSVDSVRMREVDYGIYGYACTSTGTAMDVDSLDLATGYTGIYADGWADLVIRNSRISDVEDGLGFYPVRGEVRGVQVTGARDAAMYVDPDSSARIAGNLVACGTYAANGVQAQSSPVVAVDSNTIDGCRYGIYGNGVDTLSVRGNAITAPALTGYADRGIYSYGYTPGRRSLVQNTLTGSWRYGSIYAYDTTYVRVDSNTVSNGIEAGIWVDRADTVLVRGNTVDRVLDAACCGSYQPAGIILGPFEALGVQVDVRFNRVTRSANGVYLYRTSTDTSTVMLDSNRVYGSSGVGVWVYGYTKILARKNTIDSTGTDAVRIDRFLAGDGTVEFGLNNITRSGAYGFANIDGGAVLAQNNWWGDALGPAGAAGAQGSTGDSVSSGVTWDPQLGAPADAFTAPPAGFAAVADGTGWFTQAQTAETPAARRPARRQPRPAPDPADLGVIDVPERRSFPDGVHAADMRATDRVRVTQLTEQQERLRTRAAERKAALEQAAARERAREAARAARPVERQ